MAGAARTAAVLEQKEIYEDIRTESENLSDGELNGY